MASIVFTIQSSPEEAVLPLSGSSDDAEHTKPTTTQHRPKSASFDLKGVDLTYFNLTTT
jgi:hypothetical protein